MFGITQVDFIVATVTGVLGLACAIAVCLRKRPATRDLLWRTTLIVVALTPGIAWLRVPMSNWQIGVPVLAATDDATFQQARAPVETAHRAAMTPVSPSHGRSDQPVASRLHEIPPRPQLTADLEQTVDSAAQTLTAEPTVVNPYAASPIQFSWLTILGAVWLSGVSLQCVRILRGLWKARRLVANAQLAADPALHALVSAAAHRAGLKRPARLVISATIQTPVVCNIVRQTIVIPQQLAEISARDALRAALLHECGHIRRHDIAFDLLLRIVNAFFWPHPLVYVMAADMRRLREEICDNYVLVEESPVAYAEILLRLSVGQRLAESGMIVAGMFSRRHRLEERVDAILSPARSRETRARRAASGTIFALSLCSILALALIRLERVAAAPPATDATPAVAEKPNAVNKPATTQSSKAAPKPIEAQIRIVNSRNEPVVGASVTPWGLSGTSGSSFCFEEPTTTAKTDSSGLARVAFTEKMETVTNAILGSPGHVRILNIALRVEHPDYPTWSEYLAFGGDKPIVLSDAMTVTIRAHREGESQPATRLYPSLTRSNGMDWSEENGVLTLRRVDVTGEHASKWLRVIHVPEQGTAWFSEVVDLTKEPGNPIVLDLTLRPAVGAAGRLDDSVPRPIKNGRVLAQVISGSESWANSIWNAAADIAADGTFVLESLPPEENLQLIAMCDGWVSRTPTQQETKAYCDKHAFQIGKWTASAGQVIPQFFRIEKETVQPVVAMSQAGACEVTVVDQQQKPVPNAAVHFWPNQVFHKSGSTVLGAGFDAAAYIRSILASNDHKKLPTNIDAQKNFAAQTDERGIATIPNLPAGDDKPDTFRQVQFLVAHEKYEAVPNHQLPTGYPGGIQMPMLAATLEPGKTSRVTVRMVPRRGVPSQNTGENQNATDIITEAAEGELAGRVVDQNGEPVADVEVQVMLTDHFKIRTDHLGQFRHQFGDMFQEDEQLVSVRFIKPGFAPYLESEFRLGTENRVVTLDNQTWFEGMVRKPDGQPAANVLVQAQQDGGTLDCMGIGAVFTEARTDANGRYKMLVQPGVFCFSVRDSASGSARLPKLLPGEDFYDRFYKDWSEVTSNGMYRIASGDHKTVDVQLEPSVNVSFKFVNSLTGQPVQGVYAAINEEGDEERHSDATGLLTVPALPIGECTFWLTASGYRRASSNDVALKGSATKPGDRPSQTDKVVLSGGVALELKPGMPTITVLLEPAVTLKGRILDPDGNPVKHSSVGLIAPSQNHSSQARIESWSTDGEGRFQVQVVPGDGLPRFLVGHDGKHYTDWRTFANGVIPVPDATAGQTIENLEIRLARPAVIRGRVIDKNGRPAPAVHVHAKGLDGLDGSFYDRTAKTDREGNFELRYVRPGRHVLEHSTGNVVRRTVALQPVVTVTEAQTATVGDIALLPEDRDAR